MLAEPLISWGKKGKTLEIARNSSGRKNTRKSKKARTRRLGSRGFCSKAPLNPYISYWGFCSLTSQYCCIPKSVPDVSRERRCLQASPEQLTATKDKKRQKIWISVPGRLGSFSGGGQKFKDCKNTESRHLGSLPSGGQEFPDTNGVILANRKFEWFVRIGWLALQKKYGFQLRMIRANRFARIALRIARATSPDTNSGQYFEFLEFPSLGFWSLEWRDPSGPLNSGKEKTHKQFTNLRDCPGTGGGAKNVFMCFFRVIPYGGEKTHKQNPPQNPGTIPWKFCLCVFLFIGFFPGPINSIPSEGLTIARLAGAGAWAWAAHRLAAWITTTVTPLLPQALAPHQRQPDRRDSEKLSLRDFDRRLRNYQCQHWKAKTLPKFSTSTGNNLWEFSGIF